MRKKTFLQLLLVALLVVLSSLPNAIYAANGYEFKLEYEGDVTINQEKNANVILKGTNATPYTNVRIKIDFVSGPSTPKILATDSQGNEYNLTELGYWGPESGFQVGGDFENITPIKATYSQPGTYVSRLSLVDVNNNEAVISSNEFTITVLDDTPVVENTVNNAIDNAVNNEITNLPQTGTNIFEYAIFAVIIGAVAFVAYSAVRKR